jgi:uncharacterized protein YndB with AHSA1/START domain
VQGDRPGGPVRWRLHVPVSPERVYAALDSNDGRAAFWAESAVETAGSITFRFVTGEEHVARVLERIPPRLWCLEYFGSAARFELSADGRGGTDLLLTHHDIPPAEWHEVHAGWLNVLFPLKAWLAHGVDLRNHDPARSWLAGYADQ